MNASSYKELYEKQVAINNEVLYSFIYSFESALIAKFVINVPIFTRGSFAIILKRK